MSKERQATAAEFMGLKPYPERESASHGDKMELNLEADLGKARDLLRKLRRSIIQLNLGYPNPQAPALTKETYLGLLLEEVNAFLGLQAPTIALTERDMQEELKNQALSDKKILSVWCYDLRAALKMLLPLAESYLKDAPSDPDNAKLETARGALAKTHHLEAL